jgi:hypothetical protein
VRRAGPLSPLEVDAHRAALGLSADGQNLVDVGPIEEWTAFYDAKAGRYGLAEWERELQRACRRRFGIYDPGSPPQAHYVDDLFSRYAARAA